MTPEERAKKIIADWDEGGVLWHPETKKAFARKIAAAIRAAEEAEREAALDELAARRETHKAEEARLLCEANPLKAGCHKVAAEALQEALVAIRERSKQ